MNDIQLSGLRDAIDAKLAGKLWQFRTIGSLEWETRSASYEISGINMHRVEFRAVPEVVVRPWAGPDDVPPLCWIRNGQCDNCPSMIIGLDSMGVRIVWHDSSDFMRSKFFYIDFIRLSEAWEYSTDRKEWKPCVTDGVKG